MSVTKKVDPFKPEQPSIPGVPVATQVQEPKASAPEPLPPQYPVAAGRHAGQPSDSSGLLVAMIVLGVLLGGGGLYFLSRGSLKNPKKPSSGTTTAAAAPADTTNAEPAPHLLVGPGPIATTEELSKPWSSKKFLFRGPISAAPVEAIVVRLPGGQYWGLSLREPFGDCQLEYVTDLKKIASDYQFQADHPMVVNPCRRTVYDLTRYAPGPSDGGLVRGDIVQGTALRPPFAIEIKTKGNQVIAIRSE